MTKVVTSSPMGAFVDYDEITTTALRKIIPVGTVLAWLKSYTNTPSLPDGWAECDGSAVSDSDSPYNGQNLPDLNSGTQRFLRGSTTSGTTGGSDSHSHEWVNDGGGAGDYGIALASSGTGDASGAGQGFGSGGTISGSKSTGGASALPNYYEVVWIIKIK